jgi:hypothetical protein
VCYADDVQSTEGLECLDSLDVPNETHFLCATCAGDHVNAEIANNAGKVCCPHKEDCTIIYSDKALARVLTGDSFVDYLGAKQRIKVGIAVAEDRATQAAAAAAQAELSEEDQEAAVWKEHVLKYILDQSCPSCHAGFHFEAGCFALKCKNHIRENVICGTTFCGYCFHISTGGKSHAHTEGCEYNEFGLFGGVFESIQIANFEITQNKRRVRGLELYLQALQPGQRQRLLRVLKPQLRDYNLLAQFPPT